MEAILRSYKELLEKAEWGFILCSDDRCSLGRVFKVEHLKGVLASC